MVSAELHRDGRASRTRQLKEVMLLCSLFVTPDRGVRRVYEMYSADNYFTENSLYMNAGYWKDSPRNLDEASECLTKLVGETAGMSAGDEVLDVGFGFGDQDLFWMREFNPKRIVGLNITPSQVELARNRVAEQKLEDRIDLRVGSATEVPFEAESFDKVVALESAMHFDTREKFFHEAFRVLRPGGRITMFDIVPLSMDQKSLPGLTGVKAKLKNYMHRSLGAVPKENLYPPDVYARKLEGAGFEEVELTSIREHVFPGFVRYLSRRQHDPDLLRRYNPILKKVTRLLFRLPDNKTSDCILVTAVKPGLGKL